MGKYYTEDFYSIIVILAFLLGIALGHFIGEKHEEEELINDLCNTTQYDFCQPVMKYSIKEKKE